MAAFVAGSMIATFRPSASDDFKRTGEPAGELAKGGAPIAFVSMLDGNLLRSYGLEDWAFAALGAAGCTSRAHGARDDQKSLGREGSCCLFLVRSEGFSSVVYAAVVGSSGMPEADNVLGLTALVVILSAIAHSSTDVTVAGWWGAPPGEIND